jgi:four helix bundle protein
MSEKEKGGFHAILSELMDSYVDMIYDCTKKFPREEIFGVTSQLRRSALSVPLNYVEGYARQRKNILRNFIEISYGSLKESLHFIKFSENQRFIKSDKTRELENLGDRIGKMLWGILKRL